MFKFYMYYQINSTAKKIYFKLWIFFRLLFINKLGEKLGRWIQHFSLLYSIQNVITDAAFQHKESLTTMDDIDTEPTVKELSKAIKTMASDSDGIPADLLQHSNFAYYPSYMIF